MSFLGYNNFHPGGSSTPRARYSMEEAKVKARGIPFTLTFEQWWDLWRASGKWSQRGRAAGQFWLSRHGDTGPYEIGNVAITCN